MATITTRKKADGTVVYKAEIVIKKGGLIAHRESKTFDKAKLARDWGMRREVELQELDVYKKRDYFSIKALIDQYLRDFPPTGRTKQSDLTVLSRRDICNLNAHTLTAKDLIKHIRERNKDVQPQTAANDLIWLNVVLKTMKGVVDLDTDLSIFDSAREVLRAERLIAKSNQRDRRPTRAELWALSRHFQDSWMLHVMWFAIYSARRESEIVRIEWDDISHADRTCVLRDLKDPRKKGSKARFKIPASAYKIIMRQPKVSQFVFPRNGKTIGTLFSRACKVLDIEDLHFHDLRHECTSRLFERGLKIQEVQQITLHKTWSTLQRYCNLNPGDVDV